MLRTRKVGIRSVIEQHRHEIYTVRLDSLEQSSCAFSILRIGITVLAQEHLDTLGRGGLVHS